jgi:hypothetical protein
MGEQEQRDIARKILVALYDSWAHHGHLSLNSLIAEEKWDRRLFDDVIDKLQDERGLIKLHGSPNVFDLTREGVLYVEDNGIVSEEEANRHRKIRAHVLSYLADFNDKEGNRAHALWQDIAKGAPVDQEMQILQDLSLLNDLGYTESASTSSFRITPDGLRFHRGPTYEDIV